ncbi:hypothetical protein AVEN_230470-1 [Araneus ventricosus]|uniref:Uncharacterized protein n=1 Tax=Araneus ventricosus TaxID=182803 RepID=A0A4Y2IYG5_ARAVE|nr:hypothetical protein AVEN_230470-1 [Araneus ventricosus]
MKGNLANDLKMVKNEIKLLQGDIKDFKEERRSLLLQIQEKNKNVENLKSNNDSIVKTNAYYDKKKSGKLSLRKGEIVPVKKNYKATAESTETQPRYRGPMVVTEIIPSNTYRISQLEFSNGRLYATKTRVSQLKAWRSWNEDNDFSENFDDEPGMQRPKRTVQEFDIVHMALKVKIIRCFKGLLQFHKSDSEKDDYRNISDLQSEKSKKQKNKLIIQLKTMDFAKISLNTSEYAN